MTRRQERAAGLGARTARLVSIVLAVAAGLALATAIPLAVASFVDPTVHKGEAGPVLARLLAAAAGLSGGFLLLMSALLLPEPPGARWLSALSVGAIAGLLETALLLRGSPAWAFVLVPLAAFVLVAVPRPGRRRRTAARQRTGHTRASAARPARRQR